MPSWEKPCLHFTPLYSSKKASVHKHTKSINTYAERRAKIDAKHQCQQMQVRKYATLT